MSLASRLKVAAIGGLAAIVLSACGSAQSNPTPTDTTVVTASASPSPSPYVSPSPTRMADFPDISEAFNAGYTKKQIIDYYMEIAFGAELFTKPSDVIRKWDSPVVIYSDNANDYELGIMQGVVDELRELTNHQIILTKEKGGENITIHFLDSFGGSVFSPNYDKVRITNCGISIHRVREPYLSSAIREEVTQCLGLFKDSYTYSDSVFYDPPDPVITAFSPLDDAVIKIHYWQGITLGMTQNQVSQLLNQYVNN